MSSVEQRLRYAAWIFKREARFDSHKRLKVYFLPPGDGGGTYEVAGINDRYHPVEAARLRSLVEQGEYAEATRLAIGYIADYTDPVTSWSQVPAVEAFLRDSAFNRGRGGAAKILQMAVGADVDGAVGKNTLAATSAAEKNPKQLLEKLRAAREAYERSLGRDEDSKFWKGLKNRWDALLQFCLDELEEGPALTAAKVARTRKTRVAKKSARATAAKPTRTYRLNARPDMIDFRDRFYEASLVQVPVTSPLAGYLKHKNPVLDQGQEGACTGFALATVANFLLLGRGDVSAAKMTSDGYVSPRMLYAMARRYDEWPGENYDGSSARGAMKGWHKHGLCTSKSWPYVVGLADDRLTQERAEEAADIPLGAYLRINHKDIVAMHAALAEVGILYATAQVHDGWDTVDSDGEIPWSAEMDPVGGHAFALVGYDATGFWLQNSWGPTWGKKGCAHITYADWLANATDTWVARLGVPVKINAGRATISSRALTRTGTPGGYSYEELRPHIISITRNGELRRDGEFATSPEFINQLFQDIIPKAIEKWKKPQILLYAHGGLNSEEDAVRRVEKNLRPLLEHEIFPIAFAWNSDATTTIKNIVVRAWESLGIPSLGRASFFEAIADRWDETLEVVLRGPGKALWDEMKLNALQATQSKLGGARILVERMGPFLLNYPKVRTHLIGHSAGAVLLSPLVQKLATPGPITGGLLDGEEGYGHQVSTLNYWAPACTDALFKTNVAPLVGNGIERFNLFVLDDPSEKDDTVGPYRKSLLYLVSNSFESVPRTIHGGDGTPILGLHKFAIKDPVLKELFKQPSNKYIVAPGAPESNSVTHGGFDDDSETLKATLKIMRS